MANKMSRSTLLVAVFLLLSAAASAGQTQEWLRMLENPRYPSQRLMPGNELLKYSKYDLSTLLVPRAPFLGYIGNDYRRLNMYFTSVSKIPKEDNLYLVLGNSLVGKNKCEFRGSIKIEQVREYQTLHYGIDETYKDAGIKAQGALIGRYKFEGTPGQSHSGVFEGIMTAFWVVDRNGIIHSDHIEWYSDNYRNNQYVGTWTEYGKSNGTVANWGEARIPFSSKLDIGAGEFAADPKYRDKGWGELYLP
jgi:hypothetical protein